MATYQSLGEEEILERSNQELIPQFEMAHEQMVQKAGGSAEWDKLPATVPDQEPGQSGFKVVMLRQNCTSS